MIRETKYIIRRVIIGVLIAIILSFINSFQVNAQTYNVINDGTTGNLYSGAGNRTINIVFGQNYTTNSDEGLNQVIFKLDTGMVDDGYGGSTQSTLYAGSYLFDFYIVSNRLDSNLSNCKDLNTDYRFVDLTTGNTVIASSSIKSQCINSYYTHVDGTLAIHYLVKFTITNTQSYDYSTHELFFINNLYHGYGFTQDSSTFSITVGNVYDFDSTIVTTFNNQADNGTIIGQNDTIIAKQDVIISAIDGVIARQNQAHNDSISEQNTMNNNTNSIINNQDSNTQDIIDNQNSNTQQQIESQKVCVKIDKNNIIENGYLDQSGLVVADSSTSTRGVTNYIRINKNSTLSNIKRNSTSNWNLLCFYNINKSNISCVSSYVYNGNNNISIPENASYVRFTVIRDLNEPQFELCNNGNQALNDSVNDLNDNIINDNIDSADSSVSDWSSKSLSDNVVSDMVTMPITLLQAYLNGMNSTCTSFSLGNLMGTDLILPCINLSGYFGSLWNIIDVLFSGFMIFAIGKKFVKIFNDFTNLKDNQVNELYGGGN